MEEVMFELDSEGELWGGSGVVLVGLESQCCCR